MAKYKTLNRIEAVWNKIGGEEGVDRLLKDELIVVEKTTLQPPPKPKKKLLEFISTVFVSAAHEPFFAKDKFVVSTTQDALVKISYVGNNLFTWFLAGDGKVEQPSAEQQLAIHRLRKDSVDGPIIAELGGEEAAEVSLSTVFSFMEKQGRGEDGVLLDNGYWNLFYVRDRTGVLRAVSVDWHGDGWHVYAPSVEHPYSWNAGHQVFSRNSCA